jgi:hypothetical protein
MREFSIALSEDLDAALRGHLERRDGQEDLCFATWVRSTGANRDTAIVTSIVLPQDGDRNVHGNASFEPQYLTRALGEASSRAAGLVFLHSHRGPGWQGMSRDDVVAETRISPAAYGATGLPLVGMTSGKGDAWSGRRWKRVGPRAFEPEWAEGVRAVGRRLTYTPSPRAIERNKMLERTTSVWGPEVQETFARMRVGVIGVGSVGGIVAEALARQGVERLVLVDHDRVETRNLDRLLIAARGDVGKTKVDVAAAVIANSRTANSIDVAPIPLRCDEPEALSALVDCDVIFSCVDRPWPRRILNQLSMAAMVPLIDGGILVRRRGARIIGADWHVHTSGPGRRCLQCWRAFDPSEAGLDRDGLLDDPNYVAQLDADSPLRSRANVLPFALSAASLALLQFAALVAGPLHDVGDQNYHFATGRMDVTPDNGCNEGCIYAAVEGAGDRGLPPTRRYARC